MALLRVTCAHSRRPFPPISIGLSQVEIDVAPLGVKIEKMAI